MPENPKSINHSGATAEAEVPSSLSQIGVQPIHEEADINRVIEQNHPNKDVLIEGPSVHPSLEPTQDIVKEDVVELNKMAEKAGNDSTEKYGLLQKIKNVRKNIFRRKETVAHAA